MGIKVKFLERMQLELLWIFHLYLGPDKEKPVKAGSEGRTKQFFTDSSCIFINRPFKKAYERISLAPPKTE